jgi:hypothetical protein
MATQGWTTRIRHDSDAAFREWGLELSQRLAAAGLVQTADTGQINWATAVRPGTTQSSAGYEIWRMNDAQQATAPVFFRIDYGTGGSATQPRLLIQVGTATNGAGVLSGIITSSRNIFAAITATSDVTRASFLCVADGFFGLAYKCGSFDALFLFCRTVDAAGTATSTGAMCVWGIGSSSGLSATQALRFAAPAAAYAAQTGAGQTALCLSPQSRDSSQVGSDTQAFVAWTITPQVAPLVQVCGVVSVEIPLGATFSTTPVGSTPRTYIALDVAHGPAGPIPSANTGGLKFAMLWE